MGETIVLLLVFVIGMSLGYMLRAEISWRYFKRDLDRCFGHTKR